MAKGVKKDNQQTQKCLKCGKQLSIEKYIRDSKWCNNCRKKIHTSEQLEDFCNNFYLPFNVDVYNESVSFIQNKYNDLDKKDFEKRVIGRYFSLMNMHQNKLSKSKKEENQQEEQINIPYELVKKWGKGYKTEEYFLFEDKYQRLKNSFQLPTESHREFLQKACVCSVKADMAMAAGDFKQAKEWMTMFKDTTSAGKLQPSQMSKADLSSGMDTFGQCARMVEQAVDVISILPKFKEKPKDKVDFNIWCWANYVRQLFDMPLCDYKDIWQFYEERKRDFEQSNHFLDDEEGGF